MGPDMSLSKFVNLASPFKASPNLQSLFFCGAARKHAMCEKVFEKVFQCAISSVRLSVRLSVSPLVLPFTCPSVHPSAYLSDCPLSVHYHFSKTIQSPKEGCKAEIYCCCILIHYGCIYLPTCVVFN